MAVARYAPLLKWRQPVETDASAGRPLERREHHVDRKTEEAGRNGQRVHLRRQAERLGDVHDLTEARNAHEELRGEGQDQRDRRGDA